MKRREFITLLKKLVECALNGEPWAISQVADRIDGKAPAEIQTEQRHRYVIEIPAVKRDSLGLSVREMSFAGQSRRGMRFVNISSCNR
jgi:hypothetical protein